MEFLAWRHIERFPGWYSEPDDFWSLPEEEQYKRMNYEAIRQAEEFRELRLLARIPDDDGHHQHHGNPGRRRLE